MALEWEQLIQIDRSWVDSHLNFHFSETRKKVVTRGYTLKVSGTQVTPHALADELALMIPEYVFSRDKIVELGDRKAYKEGIAYFGKKFPTTDGKYGELLLFALVEGVLGCKMVAHKIKALSNFKDQVKGGDGIFLGNYPISEDEKHIAYLIGESKLMTGFTAAVKDACKSLDRFHDTVVSTEFCSTELVVARDHMVIDSSMDIDELYDRLTPTSDLFKAQLLVHPVLIMYNQEKISRCEQEAPTPAKLEELITEVMKSNMPDYCDKVDSITASFPNIQKVYLDFFIIPFNNIDSFRNAMYYKIHGVSYPDSVK